MSPVPYRHTSQKETVTPEKLFSDRLPFLGIQKIAEPRGWKKMVVRPYPKCCRRLVTASLREGAILIFSSGAREKIIALSEPWRRQYFARLVQNRTALLIFAQSPALPVLLKRQLQSYHLAAAASPLHESLLESRIKAIIREKIHHCVTVHGVVLELGGRGILITGPSGIGKTTAAMQAVGEGYAWIADDVAMIRKNQGCRLIISGHRAIQNYIHTRQTGIVAADRMWHRSQINNKAELAFVVEVSRSKRDDVFFRVTESEIMGTRLPLIRVRISRTGYFNKNLLMEAIQQFHEVG
jgi:serine kinase of HPr protein (carbohydrate metabolism regulator)